MFALANIEVRQPIEVDGLALASMHDVRVRELTGAHPNFREFLSRFTTEFGQPIVPSIFICRDDAPTHVEGLIVLCGPFRWPLGVAICVPHRDKNCDGTVKPNRNRPDERKYRQDHRG